MAVSATHNGWRKPIDYTGSELVALSRGQRRFDVGNATLTQEGGPSSALLLGMGSSTTRAQSGTANAKFVSFYTEGDADGIYGAYFRHYVGTAGISNDAVRAFGTVDDVTAATARGAHVSLSFGTSGKVSGLAAALEATLHMPSGGGMGGTNYAIKAAINADGAGSDPAGATTIAFIGVVAQGRQAGIDDFEDDGVFLDFSGFTADGDAAHFLSSVSLAELPSSTIGIRCKVGAGLYYLPLVAAAEWN